jgi:hypothetical protein
VGNGAAGAAPGWAKKKGRVSGCDTRPSWGLLRGSFMASQIAFRIQAPTLDRPARKVGRLMFKSRDIIKTQHGSMLAKKLFGSRLKCYSLSLVSSLDFFKTLMPIKRFADFLRFFFEHRAASHVGKDAPSPRWFAQERFFPANPSTG